MPDFEEMYFKLFAAVSDAMEILDSVQKEMEELYIRDDYKPKLIKLDSKKEE